MNEEIKLKPQAAEILSIVMSAYGKKGGKIRAQKHDKEKLREWGKLGGRPKKTQQSAPLTEPNG